MDRKSIIILFLSFLLLLIWFPMMEHFYPRRPAPRATNDVETVTEPLRPPVTRDVSPELRAPAQPPRTRPGDEIPEQLVVLESESAIYTFTSHGGGVKLVEIKGHPESIDCSRPVPGERRLAGLNRKAPAPALSLHGGEAIQGDGIFQLRRHGPNTVIAEKTLENGLYLRKEFHLGTNFLFNTRVLLENRSREPMALPAQEWVVGTATPLGYHEEAHVMGVFWYDGARDQHITDSWFQNRTLGCFPGTPRAVYQAGNGDVHWAAVHNQFFTMAVIPAQPAQQIVSRKIPLPPPDPEILQADRGALRNPTGFQTSMVYPAAILAANQSIEREYTVYAGPKEYKELSRLGARMENELDRVMDFTGFFGFFAKALLLSMNGLNALGLSYGLSIIGITVIIKLLFWPLTNASTRSMKRMAALQPQMKALQEKYKEDPKKMNQKLMEFMKENKVSPLGGCLPMLLQIPVFIGFYKMLQSAIELRGESFLWACDLSQADTVFRLGGFPFNPLPLIMGVTMLWQARMTPISPSMDPMQQKLMRYMPLMFVGFLYNMSAGLTLYWTVQNLLTIVQMKLTKTAPVDTATPAVPGKPAGPAKPDAPARPVKPTPKKKKP
jgi:YidC/Oxa1 family membrane protein insertase